MNVSDENINVFNQDVLKSGGYLYTTGPQLSGYLANERLTRFTLEMVNLKDKNVIDIGCGDGTYTIALFDRGRPSKMVGMDSASKAIKIATNRKGNRPILFQNLDICSVSFPENTFDVVIVRGLLHHLPKPMAALSNILPIATEILILEPNGYNPVLKMIEKMSSYHIKHKEKSYFPHLINRWVQILGGEVAKQRFVNLVPFFCPDWMAYFLNSITPIIERIPIINCIVCGTYGLLIKKRYSHS